MGWVNTAQERTQWVNWNRMLLRSAFLGTPPSAIVDAVSEFIWECQVNDLRPMGLCEVLEGAMRNKIGHAISFAAGFLACLALYASYANQADRAGRIRATTSVAPPAG
jgi:hypothetical protein